MLKLTRLNHHPIAINPDHISWVDETPDTTLSLIGGDRIIVRETLDQLIDEVIRFRRLIRGSNEFGAAVPEGDPPRVGPRPSAPSSLSHRDPEDL